MSFLYTDGIKQIIPNKRFEDSGNSIFASGQGQHAMLTVLSPLYVYFLQVIFFHSDEMHRGKIYLYVLHNANNTYINYTASNHCHIY
jgi:hypothetical protein